jgi:hypothetical protein
MTTFRENKIVFEPVLEKIISLFAFKAGISEMQAVIIAIHFSSCITVYKA